MLLSIFDSEGLHGIWNAKKHYALEADELRGCQKSFYRNVCLFLGHIVPRINNRSIVQSFPRFSFFPGRRGFSRNVRNHVLDSQGVKVSNECYLS